MIGEDRPSPEVVEAIARLDADASDEAVAAVAEHAAAGWAEARLALGRFLAEADDARRDLARAAELFEQAAEAGNAEAQFRLAQAHAEGLGVARDPVLALSWYIVAAAYGHEAALTARERGFAEYPVEARKSAVATAQQSVPGVIAGWSRDLESGTAVWLPSRFRDGNYRVRVEVPALGGYAHGQGRVLLTDIDSSAFDHVVEGLFHRGHGYGTRLREEQVHFLPSDDYLLRLPDSGADGLAGVAFWLAADYSGVEVDPCSEYSRRHPDILVMVPDGYPVLDDAALEAAMREGWRLYAALCPNHVTAGALVLPPQFKLRRRRDNGRWEFQPQIASASFYGERGVEVRFGQFQNHFRYLQARAAEEAERRRQEARFREQLQRSRDAAKTRGQPDVRGLRLGMTLAEVRALFEAELKEWEPPWQADRVLPPFRQFKQEFRLTDGALFRASFTSPVHGSVLYEFAYEQIFQAPIPGAELEADLRAKYGEPDKIHGGGAYWHYELESRRPDEALGALLKVHLTRDVAVYETGDGKVRRVGGGPSDGVSELRLVLSDGGLGSYDLRGAYGASVEAKRQAYEASKSERPKF